MLALAFLAGAVVTGDAAAELYTVAYTGTVTGITQFPAGEPLPADVAVGVGVQGEIRFDTEGATEPTYQYISCSGSCGGGAVTALHRYSTGLTHTVRIGGQTWTTYLGNVSLSNSSLSPQGLQQTILAEDGDVTGRYASLSVYFNAPVGEATLFPDLNVLRELQFGNAAGGVGSIRRGSSDAAEGYYVSFAVTNTTASTAPSPAAGGGGGGMDLFALLVAALGALSRGRPRPRVMHRRAGVRGHRAAVAPPARIPSRAGRAGCQLVPQAPRPTARPRRVGAQPPAR
jgi:hypothetical protein